MQDNSHNLGDAIREMIEAYGLKPKLSEARIVDSWNAVVGEMIQKHTKDMYIRHKKLYVRIDSPALKNELTYSRFDIMAKLNEAAGGEVITEIIFL